MKYSDKHLRQIVAGESGGEPTALARELLAARRALRKVRSCLNDPAFDKCRKCGGEFRHDECRMEIDSALGARAKGRKT